MSKAQYIADVEAAKELCSEGWITMNELYAMVDALRIEHGRTVNPCPSKPCTKLNVVTFTGRAV